MAPARGESDFTKMGTPAGGPVIGDGPSSPLPPKMTTNAIIAASPTTAAMAAGMAHLGSLGGTVRAPCISEGGTVFSGPVAFIRNAYGFGRPRSGC